MKSSEIRERFLKYFESKGHKVLPGSSLIPADPTVLLTLAGMLQFKPIFLGVEKPKYKKAATVQKCIRLNDVENVGKTSRHHTFFEMLGNFSFGDYFKKDAIAFAWELLTKEFVLPEDKLHVAVFEKDDEAFNIWRSDINFPAERIHRLGEDNNFWAAGPTGPCGPCSEIYFDLGAARGCGNPQCAPGCDCDRFLEIWNLVFIQYNRDESGQMLELPSKNIDTGMGLERIASVLQGVESNFETDLFVPIINGINEIARERSGKAQGSIRIIADHIRAVAHLIADGVLPSNESRGYVLRRLIRRAVRHGKLIGINDPFLYKLAGIVSQINGDQYPELKKEIAYISQVIRGEEDHFRNTLEQGLIILNKLIAGGTKKIPGKEVFMLHDTYGFPVELTREICMESGVALDEDAFKRLMGEQKELGRSSGISAEVKQYTQKLSGMQHTKFDGYHSHSTEAKIVHIEAENSLVILDKTVFYPEGGGQVGDTGKICSEGKEYDVVGTYGRIGDVIAHKLKSIKGLQIKGQVKASIDVQKRKATSAHHTATHLLHSTLRELYGKELKQSGSFVSPDGFRFDFNHIGSISKDDLDKIERRVNDLIKEKLKVEVHDISLVEAEKMGALMLFGEKYGENVRMIKIGNFSTELCGGTHVKSSSEIGCFKITAESSISYGVRRIEAKAGEVAKQYILRSGSEEWEKNKQMFGKYEALELKKEFLEGKPETYYQFFRITTDDMEDLKKAITQCNVFLVNRMLDDFKKKNDGLSERIQVLGKDLETENLRFVIGNLDGYIKNSLEIKGTKVIKCEFKHYSGELLRKISDEIKSRVRSYVAALFSVHGNKTVLILSVSDDLVEKGVNAGSIVKSVSSILGGGGGGKKNIAEAGGTEASNIPKVFERIIEEVKEIL